jgi:hypothetical protein
MFPEFIAIDLTFGTNLQRRPLFVAAGIDGCNKSFTCFRAFAPSKSHCAMNWIIHNAFAKMMGPDITKHVSVISSDMEDSLVNNVNSVVLPFY